MPAPANRGADIEIVVGDITTIEADAIVNAANSALAAGGGVCGAIFRAAGYEELTEACRAIGGCPTGSAAITPAFAIKSARYIIHAVGPVYASHSESESRRLLASAYASAIRLAHEHGCASLAFPAISTGIYGYPLKEACEIAVATCRTEAAPHAIAIKLVAFDDGTASALRAAAGVA